MRKGFTLIELLVVIAIIGILASVVIVSFPKATQKARDTRLKSALSQVRVIATMMGDSYSHYGQLCNASNKLNTADAEHGTTLAELEGELNANGGSDYVCYDNGVQSSLADAKYCVATRLNVKLGGQTQYFCIDYQGRATTTVGANNPCTTPDYDCLP